jgi:hypothetical protein
VECPLSSGWAGWLSMTDLTARSVPSRPAEAVDPPALLDRRRPSAEGREEPRGDALALGAGVDLGRLLSLTRLTAAQALEIGAGVLTAAEELTGPGDGGGGIDPVPVFPRLTLDGQVVLRVPGDAGHAGSPPEAGRTVDAILAAVLAAARSSVAADGPAVDARVALLHRAVQDLPTAGVAVVARRLQESAAAADRTAVRAELAALARVVAGMGASAPAGAPSTAANTGRAGQSPRTSGSAGRRIGAWLLSVLVLGAAVVSEVVLLRDDITADVDLLLESGRGADEPSPAPAAERAALPAPAPAAAGNVTAVDLRLLSPCGPGATCTVRVSVRLVPARKSQVVSWTYQLVEECTGPPSRAPGGSVTVPPRADRVDIVGTVPVPEGDGTIVFAVTDDPASAASAPVVIGTCGSPGPGA